MRIFLTVEHVTRTIKNGGCCPISGNRKKRLVPAGHQFLRFISSSSCQPPRHPLKTTDAPDAAEPSVPAPVSLPSWRRFRFYGNSSLRLEFKSRHFARNRQFHACNLPCGEQANCGLQSDTHCGLCNAVATSRATLGQSARRLARV